MYCKYCGNQIPSGSVCEKCKQERKLISYKKTYEKTKEKRFNPERWEFKIGVRKNKIAQLQKEIEDIAKRIREGK